MRKWICVGVLGGLLEFGIVYQVAFSDSDSPAPETVQASETNRRQKARKTARHLTSAVGSSGQAVAGESKAPAGAAPADKVAAPANSITAPPGSPGAAGQPAPVVPPQPDPLGVTLTAAVSAVAAVPAVLAQLTAPPSPGAGAAPLPVDLQALLAGQAEAVQLAKVLPVPEPAPAPVPIDLSKLPIEEMIRQIFGPDGEKAVEVARCESTMRTHAKKGQFLGLFQMGENERADYGHGPDALAQVKAAFALFQARGWQPWECA
jgi:hypothetical protein